MRKGWFENIKIHYSLHNMRAFVNVTLAMRKCYDTGKCMVGWFALTDHMEVQKYPLELVTIIPNKEYIPQKFLMQVNVL